MAGIAAVWRCFPSTHTAKRKAEGEVDTSEEESTISEDDSVATGSEWLLIDEPVGFFFPKMQKRIQHLHLDQAQHLLHYGNFKHVMRLHNISLVTSVEELGARGKCKWWMTVQDPSTLQVWVIYFPSRHRLQAWINLLSSVFNATNSRALRSNPSSIHSAIAAPTVGPARTKPQPTPAKIKKNWKTGLLSWQQTLQL